MMTNTSFNITFQFNEIISAQETHRASEKTQHMTAASLYEVSHF